MQESVRRKPIARAGLPEPEKPEKLVVALLQLMRLLENVEVQGYPKIYTKGYRKERKRFLFRCDLFCLLLTV